MAFQNMEIEQTMGGDVLLRAEQCPLAMTRAVVLDGISALIQANEIGRSQE